MDIALSHIATYRAGDIDYYNSRERGTVEVWYDSKRYVYRPDGMYKARQFRQFIATVWGGKIDANGLSITGTWPVYHIE